MCWKKIILNKKKNLLVFLCNSSHRLHFILESFNLQSPDWLTDNVQPNRYTYIINTGSRASERGVAAGVQDGMKITSREQNSAGLHYIISFQSDVWFQGTICILTCTTFEFALLLSRVFLWLAMGVIYGRWWCVMN